VFDFGQNVELQQFGLAQFGDVTHDIVDFQLLFYNSETDTYSPVTTDPTEAGTGSTTMQYFTITTSGTARYWMFNITSTSSGYQAVPRAVDFV